MVAPKIGEGNGPRARMASPASLPPSAVGLSNSSSARPGQAKSCMRQAPSGSSSVPPDTSAYTYHSPQPARHNRHDSLHRYASPNRQVVPVPARTRPAFVRGSTQVHDPSRPVLRRAPTPFHHPDEARDEDGGDGDDDVLHMEEKEYVDIELVVDQVAGFLNDLSGTIGPQLMRKYISADKVYALHQAPTQASVNGKVFGVPVRTACAVAPCLAFFSGHQQHLPLVVFTVIEEIYSRGMDVPGLFRISGDENSVDHLVQRFSVEPYGEDVDINNETIPDLCGLLQAWLQSLPVPILEPVVERAFFSLVVCGEQANLAPDDRVRVAQLLLRLLPAPNLSVFVYLVSFLTHFQRATKLHIGGVAGLFAKPLAAKPIHGHSENAKRARRDAAEDAKEVVKWLLMNWHLVMDGLMDDPVLEVNPFGGEDVDPYGEVVVDFRPSSTAVAGRGTQSVPPARPTPPPIDPSYVANVRTTLDGLAVRLATILGTLDGMSDAPADLRSQVTGVNEVVQAAKEANKTAADEAEKRKVEVEEVVKLRQRVEEVETEKANVEKKLKAAHKALTAALAPEET